MQRRQFLKGAAAGGALAASRPGFGNQAQTDATATASRTLPLPPMHMHVGTQRRPTDRETLEFCKRHGVDHVCGYPLDPNLNDTRQYWTLDELERTRDLCEQHGISLDMVTVPLLWSRSVDIARFSAIMLADDPERDRDIEHIQDMIRHCARAGVPAFKYNMNLLGVLRTEPTPGRGGSRYSTWTKPATAD
ncbi:MAG: twin-arginine translocation signal domain-containing protein [Proteobacteria bacterium]|nr:twin-arginine translocation signal domain-containing protein [Pseudomonadota bacterium]